MSDPKWLGTLSIACAGLGLASLGWTSLQVVWVEQYLTLGRWWSVGSPRLYVAGSFAVICAICIAASLLLLKDEGRAIDRGRSERVYAMIGVAVFSVGCATAGICFWRLNFLYDWIFQFMLPLLFAAIGNATLLFAANRLRRGEIRLPERIVWWACVALLIDMITAIAWVPAVLFHLGEGIRLQAFSGPGLGFVPMLIVHSMLALFATLAYFIAARRFWTARRDATRAWSAE